MVIYTHMDMYELQVTHYELPTSNCNLHAKTLMEHFASFAGGYILVYEHGIL